MAKTASTTSPAPAPKHAQYPRPEIFWNEEEGEPQPLRAPIEKIYVYQQSATGGRDQIDVTTLDGLPDWNALRDTYGPGMFDLEARDANGGLLCKRTHRVKMPPGKAWQPLASSEVVPNTQGPAVTPDPSDPSAFLRSMMTRDPFTAMLMKQVLELSSKLSEAHATAGAKLAEVQATANSQVTEAISRLAGARITDAQEFAQQMLAMRGRGSGRGDAAAFEAGMEKMRQLLKPLIERDDDDGPSDETNMLELMKTFVEGMREFKSIDSEKPVNVVPLRKAPPQ